MNLIKYAHVLIGIVSPCPFHEQLTMSCLTDTVKLQLNGDLCEAEKPAVFRVNLLLKSTLSTFSFTSITAYHVTRQICVNSAMVLQFLNMATSA